MCIQMHRQQNPLLTPRNYAFPSVTSRTFRLCQAKKQNGQMKYNHSKTHNADNLEIKGRIITNCDNKFMTNCDICVITRLQYIHEGTYHSCLMLQNQFLSLNLVFSFFLFSLVTLTTHIL